MFNLNTLVRVIRTLVMVLVFAEAAMAQSTLNFVHGFERPNDAIAIANTSGSFADVQFIFYKPDGSIPTTTLSHNPVSYRIPPKGRISLTAPEIFGGNPPAGWIQATSSISGLVSASRDVLKDQVISFFGAYPATEIQLTNGGTQSASGVVTFFDALGQRMTDSTNVDVLSHGQTSVPVPAGSASAYISSVTGIIGTAMIAVGDSSVVLTGQATNQAAATRVVPFYRNGNGSKASLILTNPTVDAPVRVFVFYVTDSGFQVRIGQADIAPNGSWSPDFSPVSESFGHVLVQSDNRPLTGVMVLDDGTDALTLPLESAASDRFLFNDASKTADLLLINTSADPTNVELTYTSSDGTSYSQKNYQVGITGTISIMNLISNSGNFAGGFVTVRSTNGTRLFGLEVDLRDDSTVVTVPQLLASSFVPGAPANLPTIPIGLQRKDTRGSDFHAGDIVVGHSSNLAGDITVVCGGKVAETAFFISDILFGNPQITFSIPPVEPGFASCKIRSGGLESPPFRIRILDTAGTLTDQLSGQAFYQKLEVTDNGLDTDLPSFRPIRNGRIEVFDAAARKVISVSETDGDGRFDIAVPPDATNLSIQAVSRLRSLDLKVEDNTNSNQYYFIASADVDMRERPTAVTIVDKTRKSGAFNILEQIQRANDFIHTADSTFAPFGFTIFWSEKNQNRNPLQPGFIQTTSFNLATGTANILGDRSTDSDEYDDSVLIHEYAHMLAAKFSRDDSPGGQHHIGDLLDPRVAWSEGMANFFSGAVRGDSIYRDSNGPNGLNVLRFDLEENFPAGSRPGYGSETSVQALLWDFLDDKSELGDTAQFDFSQIWDAIKDLKSQHYVYLPYFLDNLLARNASASDAIQRMVQAQSIDFQPGVIPSVTNPFPGSIAMNSTRTGEVDSLTTKRTNLAQSAHFFVFSTAGGQTSIRLDLIQPASNPKANDLDLFLFDMNGKLISRSDAGQNGQGELIPVVLLAGSYVIEVRSYYTNDKGATVFNSGKYNLTLIGK